MAVTPWVSRWWGVLVLRALVVLATYLYAGWGGLIRDTLRGPAPPEGAPPPGPPQVLSHSHVRDGVTRATVRVGYDGVIVFRSSHDGASAQERATAAATRLEAALVPWDGTADVSVGTDADDMPTLEVNGQFVATVDPDTAAANNSTPEGLAERWAERLRGVLEYYE